MPVPPPPPPLTSLARTNKTQQVKMKIETISKDAKVTLKFYGKCSREVVLKID
jgi:hypothetical protein